VAWSQQSDDKDHNNWSEFHGTNMTRWNPYEKVLNVHDVGNLLVKWSSTTGVSIDSSPAVMKGVVYIGSNDGKVYALNAKTGAEVWSFTTGGEPPTFGL
jgi:polyvinyl alcohol dehydrogenase (cytochrome)